MKYECKDAKIEFDSILKPFAGEYIKRTSEDIDEEGIYYVANIEGNDETDLIISKLIKDNNCQFVDNGECMFNTKYGYCDISDDGDQYTIECFVPLDQCDEMEECVDTPEDELIIVENANNAENVQIKILEQTIAKMEEELNNLKDLLNKMKNQE